MKTRSLNLEQMLMLSVGFTISLLMLRIIISGHLFYIFYAWNIFLAAIPFLISRKLYRRQSFGLVAILWLMCWLLFLPNAPYIVTDIFHFRERSPIPLWVDLILVTSAAWNGLILGIVSLLQVDDFLNRFMNTFKANLVILCSLFLSAFGVYIGRFLRFNSWDVITNPDDLVRSVGYRVIYPQDNLRTWGFTLLCGVMLWVFYYTIKKLRSPSKANFAVG